MICSPPIFLMGDHYLLSKFGKFFWDAPGASVNLLSRFQPQSNGQTEWITRELEATLRCILEDIPSVSLTWHMPTSPSHLQQPAVPHLKPLWTTNLHSSFYTRRTLCSHLFTTIFTTAKSGQVSWWVAKVGCMLRVTSYIFLFRRSCKTPEVAKVFTLIT